MHAIRVSVHPALRMFFVAACLGRSVRVYHFATVRAVPDWGVGAPVVQVWTPFPSHCGYLPKGPPCSRAVCNLSNMGMRTKAIGKMNLGNGEAPLLTAG